MPTASENALREVVIEAAENKSTGPWGPVGEMLREHANTSSGRAIGIQDYTVINRAVGSPGMQHAYGVHGFVVKPGDPPTKPPADLEAVVNRVRDALQHEPYITTAVIIPHSNEYLPSHVLSCNAPEGHTLAEAYPNAAHELQVVKGVTEGDVVHSGPWSVMVEAVETGKDGSVQVHVDDPGGELRHVFVGDGLILVEPGPSPKPFAIGRLHHVAPAEDGTFVLVFDRYSRLPVPQSATPPLQQMTDESGSAK